MDPPIIFSQAFYSDGENPKYSFILVNFRFFSCLIIQVSHLAALASSVGYMDSLGLIDTIVVWGAGNWIHVLELLVFNQEQQGWRVSIGFRDIGIALWCNGEKGISRQSTNSDNDVLLRAFGNRLLRTQAKGRTLWSLNKFGYLQWLDCALSFLSLGMKTCPDAADLHCLEFITLKSTCQNCSSPVNFCTKCYRIDPTVKIPSSLDQHASRCQFCLEGFSNNPSNADFIIMNRKLSPLKYKQKFYEYFNSLKASLGSQRLSINYLLSGEEIPSKKSRYRRRDRSKIVEWGIDYSGWSEFLRTRDILGMIRKGPLVEYPTQEFGSSGLSMLRLVGESHIDLQSQNSILELADLIVNGRMPIEPIKINTNLLISRKFLDVMYETQHSKFKKVKLNVEDSLKLVRAEIERLEEVNHQMLRGSTVKDTLVSIRTDPMNLKRIRIHDDGCEQLIRLLKQLYAMGMRMIQ